MNNLKLVLKYKWYDMIEARKKPYEYREIKEYYVSLLFNWEKSGLTRKEFTDILKSDKNRSTRELWIYLKDLDNIQFFRGYGANRKSMIIEWDWVDIGEGNPDLGSEPGKKYFVLRLGNLI